ncbi:MAG: hypothetical protein APF76_13640 [Desulfitibacter sp. BRH_c19]|nr:MAG: hypothetical protein APF76_13640 [Desulfitibacter sp. BRH_c19]
MLLSELVKVIKPLPIDGRQDLEILNIANNSKNVKRDCLFFCISGYKRDGHLYVNDAVKRGAVAVVSEKRLNIPIVQLIVENSRLAQAIGIQHFYNYPTSKFKLVGITGTNGKTTVAFLTEAILQMAGYLTGLIGTVNYKIGEKVWPAGLTTPDTIELGKMFQQLVEKKVQATVMEVSSHALELHRVTGCDFDVTVFTNLTRDHFDFHGTMENYLQCKSKLFANQRRWRKDPYKDCYAVVNLDDPHGRYISQIAQAPNILTYGINANADVRVVGYELRLNESLIKIKLNNRNYTFFCLYPDCITYIMQ